MKNNFFSTIKDKVKNTNYNFSKNFLYHLIVPAVAILVAVVLVFTVNFNLGFDFKGGSVATVVVEQDISISENYTNVKNQLNDVFKENNVDIKLYQKVETSYYGNAISVKFDRVSDELRETLRNDLVDAFYPSLEDEDDLKTFVKVDNFEQNVSSELTLSCVLAILVSMILVLVYVALRHGISAGFTTLMVAGLDVLFTVALTIIFRIRIEMSVVASFMFAFVYSVLNSVLFFNRMSKNLNKEIYQKTSNVELANITVKQSMNVNILLAFILLVFALFMGVVPTTAVRATSLPVMLGVIVCLYSSFMLTPGLFAMTYIRKVRKQKEEVVVVEEESGLDEKSLDAPEEIVVTEAKEEN